MAAGSVEVVMNPDENLKRQLLLAQTIQDAPGEDGAPDAANELAELVIALDEWIKNGGFLPRRWQPPTRQSVRRPDDRS